MSAELETVKQWWCVRICEEGSLRYVVRDIGQGHGIEAYKLVYESEMRDWLVPVFSTKEDGMKWLIEMTMMRGWTVGSPAEVVLIPSPWNQEVK